MVKQLRPFAVSAFLACGIATTSAGTPTDLSRSFDSLSSLRVTQPVTSGTQTFEAKFYSGYETNQVTISNKSARSIRFSSYQGFVAVVRPGDIFGVPCNSQSIAGQVAVLEGPEGVTVDEQALCGDLVLIRATNGGSR